jgi:endonuclease/exonuclease/phosphatase family metal-dependent hydrolase
MTFMSFNIRYGTAEDGPDRWDVRRERALELLRRRPADVVGMQEALRFQIDEIAQAFPHLGAVGVGRDDGRAAGEFAPILYDRRRLEALRADTFWLSETPEVPGSRHWGNGIPRICTWAFFRDRPSGRHFYAFNTHLDHESAPSRERGMALILERIRGRGTDDSAVLMGDLNVDESSPVVAQVRAAGLGDPFRVLHPGAVDAGTFNGFQEGWFPERIDFVFADAGWQVRSAEIVRERIGGRWPSDHFPVVAELLLNPRPAAPGPEVN